MTTLGTITPPHTDYAEIAMRPLEPERAALIVIDIQEKLLPPIFQKEQLVRNSQLLIRLAGTLKMPTLLTTQYSKGLGNTVPEVASLLTDTTPIEKQMFSCFGSEAFCSSLKRLPGNRNTVILWAWKPISALPRPPWQRCGKATWFTWPLTQSVRARSGTAMSAWSGCGPQGPSSLRQRW